MSTEPKSRHSIAPRYAAGDTIAERYRLEEVIGEGGMGTVWLARNVALDAPVALKLIRQGLESEEAANRLLEEARAAAKIEHSAIVRVFDFGETELGDPYIVMELLEGQSLADTLEARGRIEPAALVATLLPIIDGLRCAHETGVVHRDLKPSNIFLSWEGNYVQPKVVDFGVAKIDRRDFFPKLTRQGTVLGSPAYMAPEQARGQEDVDHRADVWTISVVLYEAITGAAAFSGTNYNAVMRSVIEDDVVPITELGIPEANDSRLWEILARGLAKDRDERFQSMDSLGRALAEWLFHQGITEDLCGTSLEDVWLSGDDPGIGIDDTELVPAVFALSRRRVPRTPAPFEPPVESASTRPYVRERASLPPSRSFRSGSVHWPVAVAAAVGLTMFVAAFTIVRSLRDDARWTEPLTAPATVNAPAARHSAVPAPPATPPNEGPSTSPPTVLAPRTVHAQPAGTPPRAPPIADALGIAPLGLHPALRHNPTAHPDSTATAARPSTNQAAGAGKGRWQTPRTGTPSVAVPATSWPLPASGLPAWVPPAESGADLKDPYR